jgi:hypothetical protein
MNTSRILLRRQFRPTIRLKQFNYRKFSTNTEKPKGPWTFTAIRRLIRAVQVGVLSFSIYQYGYQSGVVAYMNDSEGMSREYLNMALRRRGKTEISNSTDDADDDQKNLINLINRNRARVQKITFRLITAALDIAEEKHEKTVKLLKQAKVDKIENKKIEKLTNSSSSPSTSKTPSKPNKSEAIVPAEKVETYSIRQLEESLETWGKALKKLRGKWEVILIPDASVNAFVMSLCPKKVFVYAGLIEKLKLTDEELALILAHELSHAILDHGGEHD